MLLWVLGQQGARVSHPGPQGTLHSQLGLFWTAQVVLFWPLGRGQPGGRCCRERGLGQGARLWSLTQPCSLSPLEERRGDSWLLQPTASWKKLLSHQNHILCGFCTASRSRGVVWDP